MIGAMWLRGLLAHRRSRLLGTTAGVAVCVALLASIGAFLSTTTGRMTSRAAARVPVDWQVEVQPSGASARVLDQVRHFGGVQRALPVGFADTTGLSATSGGSSQRTGPGKLLGLPAGYAAAFPGEIRVLSGSGTGVLLAQQTAANLHAHPGSIVHIGLRGARTAPVRVAGVVDLPAADSLFQHVGAPVGAQPAAPPDNVVLLPSAQFAKVTAHGAGAPVTQIHARLSRALPGSPSAAFTQISGHARNLETRLAGAALVGDNLGTALDQARQDALYAELLFLFLGVPGAVLTALVTAAIAAAGGDRRRRDAALLRTRGASAAQLTRLAVAEAAVTGVLGVVLGLGAALAIGSIAFGTASFGAGTLSAILWGGGAALAGLAVAALAIALPGRRDARSLTVVGQRQAVAPGARRAPWERAPLDVIALVGSALIFWQASRNGYSLVLAPEGVPQVSVNWYALLAPVLAWIGAGLLAHRLATALLTGGRRPLARVLRPLAGELSPMVAASMGREHRLLARALTLVALTAAFAASTAVFNATYNQQAEVDARLTNGADVTVTESPGVSVGPQAAARLARVPGVASVEPLQHRFAYVGADLQDLYGVRPSTIGAAGSLQDSWFSGGSAAQLMHTLAQRSDGVLVSEETVKDFQLNPGDLLRLRLQDGATKRLKTIPFHYVGVAKEFPTAPHDSFFVANAAYVARATGSSAVGTFLVQTDGTEPAAVASRVRGVVGASAKVADIASQRVVVGSNLTAVELSGLTRVELGFALVLALASAGLALAIGFRERRRTFAIAAALGARARQLGAFVWAESAFVALGGLVLGALVAAGITAMLVKVLTGVFDPPPDAVAIPGGYLVAAVAVLLGGSAAAAGLTVRGLRHPRPEDLRDP
ncbi:MAG: putative transport system permease protein [Solirubrobacteraceae bacterium]|jgi:putative ABC transport system permease protein|nr:putative transport system permease protein [Solirubrobacteraceae bacterium]